MDKGPLAMASRNIPVRDELVLNIDGVFPMLKSGEGIPVLKHTKRGQSDPRRLRLDTDDSTLEVFRQSTTASFLNRKISNRTYYLRTLEEVRLRWVITWYTYVHQTCGVLALLRLVSWRDRVYSWPSENSWFLAAAVCVPARASTGK